MSRVTPDQPGPLSAAEEAAIRALARVMSVLPKLMDADMRRGAGISLTDYGILMHLSEAPGRHMRMSDLAAACDLSLSGMSRAVARLESDGLVLRVRCGEDARGWNAVLTDTGFARLEDAYPTNLVSTRRRVLDRFEGIDLAALATAFDRVAADPDSDL
ncbi:MarR family transcriptional regulator [Acrocarpospora corrugata]|uniref:MarR family transcriptional regulator n=1 Tax=Acrocarpospora corrugata TaxID=35763 RepID=A0A5M3VZY2_9ACTN|nr:MarR family transcriptional regulator [Acrocarpospora corrugata]GES02395.1 MarR family transcriptional regulator [Acrocarpospora corrugata]